MKKESLNDELKGLSPWLHDLKRQEEDGFRVPEGYFEGLEDSIFSRIEASGARRQPILEVKKGGGLRARIFQLQTLVSVAAAVTLLLAVVWFFKSNSAVPASAPLAATELSEDEIEAYVLDNIGDFDAAQLAALTPDEAVSQAPESSKSPENQSKTDDFLDDLSEEELELLLKEMSEEELESLL